MGEENNILSALFHSRINIFCGTEWDFSQWMIYCYYNYDVIGGKVRQSTHARNFSPTRSMYVHVSK